MLPVLLEPGVIEDFPDPKLADSEGLVAVGGDLSVERLLRAYDQGVFPWFGDESPELWWSPDPRAVLHPWNLHISRKMSRVIRTVGWRTTWNRAFTDVMLACSENRTDGTWIVPEMVEAYTEMNALGHAHSLEVWEGDDLIGGMYGVHRGGFFAAESMFHRIDNASKVALIHAVQALQQVGIEMLDVQLMTEHLASMGAEAMPRRKYLARIRELREKPVQFKP